MNPLTLSRRKSPLSLPIIKPRSRNSLRNHHKERGKSKYPCNRMKRLRSEMDEISVEQKKIREGQRQVREKFETVELECGQLRKQTDLIVQQSVNTQIRLAVMFQILKARENQEFDKAAKLTFALRELIARENQQKETLSNK
ncbi:uncharacterized protein LOC111276649 isoform X2 [Durio zibethinus]|uniref:Uncharacterized protein LOC111276649 isoform X2 n=1 Tax=Durio zibethinus TaxID=66656 RepID=A0A6P5WPT0_DURZI|nr:uncharacterized protein LOC111276649 isoform X2 [Durio zibethinus]